MLAQAVSDKKLRELEIAKGKTKFLSLPSDKNHEPLLSARSIQKFEISKTLHQCGFMGQHSFK